MTLSNEQAMKRAIIIDRYENPVNKVDEKFDHSKYKKFNNKSDSCIDNITVYLLIENKKIIDAKFSGIGCAISTSSSDIFCDLIKEKPLDEVELILDEYLKMIGSDEFDKELIGDLIVFENISKQINRVKCSLVGHGAIKEILKLE
ncbi:MAG: iron-sulfur cluster assembly scaffold protein [Malacoplasma sp.]